MYPSLASVAEWQTDVCPVQGIRQAPRRGRGWEGLCPHFSWDSNYVMRDLASDIRGSFFFIIWRIDIRNKEQLKLLSKLLLHLLILDSFSAISEDFKSIFAFKRPTQKPTAPKRAHINYNFKFNIRLLSRYWKYEMYIFSDPQQFSGPATIYLRHATIRLSRFSRC